jgi:ribosomal protein S18 acetylase RimI-like enzyme
MLDVYARDPKGDGKPLPDDVRERLIPGLRAHPTTVALLAFDDQRAVGVAVCFVGFSTFQARPLLNVHDLAVRPGCRGQGIGEALLAAAEAEARRRGCGKLTLEVQDDNHPARRLYQRVGFTDFTLAGAELPTRFLSKLL